jgi:acetyltransferase
MKLRGINEVEFAIVISDPFQRQGLGTQLLRLLVDIGRKEGAERIFGQILPNNYGMQRVCRKVGFMVSFDRVSEVMRAEMKLQPDI